MKRAILALVAAGVGLAGCGGGGDGQIVSGRGEVSGVIFNEDGDVVRGARVYYDASSGGERRETQSNSTGAYILQSIPGNNDDGVYLSVRAETNINGVRYTGVNIAQVFAGERTKNVNIAVFPASSQATLKGEVFTRNGDLVTGARIFARPRSEDIPTSAVALSNSNGSYVLRGLRSGLTYDIQVNAYGSSTDFYTVTLSAGETRSVDFEVGNTTDPNLPAPQDLVATAWTTPDEVTRDRELRRAMEAVKTLLKPNRKQALKTRDASNGYPIEVDLFWEGYQRDSVLGFGIYREAGSGQEQVEFLRDPLAEFYADIDDRLVERQTYTYWVSAISTAYDNGYGESPLSNSYTVETLGALELDSVTSELTFRWRAASGAERYTVYIFDEFPTVGTDFRFQSPAVTGTSYTYDGPTLANRTYYYLVVGVANEGDSLTVSRIGTFQP